MPGITEEKDRLLDEEADWVKLVDGGKARERDLAATEEAYQIILRSSLDREGDTKE